jgi:3-oxoacyl-[acyl-carrier-protein] synthase-3
MRRSGQRGFYGQISPRNSAFLQVWLAVKLTGDASTPLRNTFRPQSIAGRHALSIYRAEALGLMHAAIGPISTYLPERVETNEQLGRENPSWNMEQIALKTGVRQRHIAAADELPSDLAVAAAERLFQEHAIDRTSIDWILFCTQTPDYPLPTTACLIQERLGLDTRVGALDFNLGCSGFVYGLSLAEGLIRGGMARRVLLLTAETYSKYIHPDDRSLRTIFGDAAAATLIEAAEEPSLCGFVFGTDGRAADTLMVTEGGMRTPETALAPRKRQRWRSKLYMDGPELITISLEIIPKLVDDVLRAGKTRREAIDLFLMHQATRLMLEQIAGRMRLSEQQMPIMLEEYGNTVSSTLPLLIYDLRRAGRIRRGTQSLLVGFGVGFSWAGCLWKDQFAPA